MTVWGTDNIVEVVGTDGGKVVTESLAQGTVSRFPLMLWRDWDAKKIVVRVQHSNSDIWFADAE